MLDACESWKVLCRRLFISPAIAKVPASQLDEPVMRTRKPLRLFVAGSTPRSLHAVQNLLQICAKRPHGQRNFEVIDVYRDPDATRELNIVVAPTLVSVGPRHLRRIVGDLSDTPVVLKFLRSRRGSERTVI
jgi:circadian clock protein KaiB